MAKRHSSCDWKKKAQSCCLFSAAFRAISAQFVMPRSDNSWPGAKKFEALNANLVLVYPGPAQGLKAHAQEFIRGKTLPGNFYLVLDPDYDFTVAYGLRWEAKNETAYPSTFVIGQDGKVQFAKISTTHGGRATAEEVLNVSAKK